MLLLTKLYRPQLPTEFLTRPRLYDRLDNGRLQELTVVAAPAGYGKSTLVLAWLERQTNRVGWLSLDEHDNDPYRFWQYLILALQQAEPELGQAPRQALAGGAKPPLENIVHKLINDIWTLYQQNRTQIILVFDDYHFIQEPQIHESLNQLIDYLPHEALRVVLTTRADPPLQLAKRRARRQLCEVRMADLRFTHAEITALITQRKQQKSELEILTLAEQTEGWPAALQLALLATGLESSGTPRLPESSTRQFVADYLMEEVLGEQPVELQKFMLETAVLPRFSAALADASLDSNSSATHLADLKAKNLFLVPLNAEQTWFRYHHLFADLLQRQAEKNFDTAHHQMLQRRAAAWFAAENLWSEAIEAAFMAGDQSVAVNYLLAYLVAEPSWLDVRREWLNKLPDRVKERSPLLYLVEANLIFTDPKRDPRAEMPPVLQKARPALDNLPKPDPNLEAHYACLEIMVSILDRDGDQSALLQMAKEAFRAAPETSIHARGRLAYWLGTLNRRLNKTSAARHWLSQAQSLLAKANDVYVYVMAHVSEWEVEIESGKAVRGTLRDIRRFQQQAPEAVRAHPIIGATKLIAGTILLYRSQLEESASALESGLAQIQLTAEYGMEITGLWNLAMVRASLGDIPSALALAETLAERVPLYTTWADTLQRWFTLPQYGSDTMVTATLDRWLNDQDLGRWQANNPMGFLEMMDFYCYCRLLIKGNDQATLLSLVEILKRIAAQFEGPLYWRRRLQVQMHQIFVLQALRQDEEAKSLLSDLLISAQPELHRYTFVEARGQLAPLLSELATDDPWAADVWQTCQRYGIGPTAPNDKNGLQGGNRLLIEPLTDREIEIVTLLAEGITNKEIGIRLHLSPNTVRVHTSNIYGKLGVSGRMQAAQKAAALGLLADLS